MKRVLTAVVLIPLVLLVVFKAPLWLFALVVTLISVLALHEYLNLLKACGIQPLRAETYFMALAVLLGTWCAYDERVWQHLFYLQPKLLFGCWQILLLVPFIFGIPLIFRGELRNSLPASAGSAFGIFYIAAPLA